MTDVLRLGVNIDHVATVREARGSAYPDPVRAAKLAEAAGADGITAHLREDRRHISDADIERLSRALNIPLNLEMAATDEMLAIAGCSHLSEDLRVFLIVATTPYDQWDLYPFRHCLHHCHCL